MFSDGTLTGRGESELAFGNKVNEKIESTSTQKLHFAKMGSVRGRIRIHERFNVSLFALHAAQLYLLSELSHNQGNPRNNITNGKFHTQSKTQHILKIANNFPKKCKYSLISIQIISFVKPNIQ